MSKTSPKNKDIEKINKSIKTRTIILYTCIGIAFVSMFVDISMTRNIFRHIGELMLVSLFAFGYAIYNDYAIKRLKKEKKALKDG
jgi:hypothetical protein